MSDESKGTGEEFFERVSDPVGPDASLEGVSYFAAPLSGVFDEIHEHVACSHGVGVADDDGVGRPVGEFDGGLVVGRDVGLVHERADDVARTSPSSPRTTTVDIVARK